MQKWIGRSIVDSCQAEATDLHKNWMFRGKTKKVKKYREEGEAYKGGRNPFQVLYYCSSS